VKYHPAKRGALTTAAISTLSGTVAGGQFDWGGRLRKGNGGARTVPSARTATALLRVQRQKGA
jgi:hypothetical protein